MTEPSRPSAQLSAFRSGMARLRSVVIGLSTAAVVLASGCSEQVIEQQKPIGGSCLACHDGITDVHPFFALACVDCHGGNDAVALPAVVNVRNQELLKASHVLPLDASMWWPNGVDDDNDGAVDEAGEFFDGRSFTDSDTPFADKRLAKKDQMDSEINRDLNYLRFLKPGDLRVAEASCGSRNKNANAAMVCHAEVVYDVRRSIMATNGGVPSGATYGNAQLTLARQFGSAFAATPAGQRFDARNPRLGRVGYVLDYTSMDEAFDSKFEDPKRNILNGGGFNRALLNDQNVDPNDGKFEAVAGPIFADGATGSDAAFAPAGGPGFTRTGQKYKFYVDDLDSPQAKNNRAVEVMQPISNAAGSGSDGGRVWPDKAVHKGLQLRLAKIVGEAVPEQKQNRQADIKNLFDFELITNPVDAALRNFRAYHSLNWVGPNDNFGFVDFFTSPNANDPPRADPSDAELRNNNNPFGRGRPTGCTGCHVEYGKSGRNEEPVDRTVADNGRNPSTDLPFGIRQDRGERFYAKRHELKRTSNVQACGACHGFVTRVDVAMVGTYEQETDFTNLEKVNTIGTFEYQTPKSSVVRVFDNLAHFKNGRILNDGEGVSEDLNNNGELDLNLEEGDFNDDGVVQPNEDFNKNGKHDIGLVVSEDKNDNSKLDIPDRVARSESFDGRQNRIIYGGGNGAVRLQDIHIERGFNCTDCHIQNDVHGDGNIYTRNWDAIQIECDDCHGTNDTPAALVFSGPNGGDDMTAPRYNTAFGQPWFERIGDKLIERSRVVPNLSWVVPQLKTPRDNTSAYAHRQRVETFDPALDHGNEACAAFADEDVCTVGGCSWDGEACKGFERSYAHIAEPGEKGGLECYSCHSSWQPNCLSCHIKMDVTKPKQEIWWGDDDVEDIFFQLFSYTRSPFYLGLTGNTEGNKIAPHRSTMQVHVSVVAGAVGLQLAESAVFSTKENLSSMVSNPYFPHTVRTTETKQCARCHTLEDAQGNIANDHLVTEATGHGTGRYQNIGDWAVVSTTEGLDLLDMKKENGGGITFPGFDFSDKVAGGELRRRVSLDLDTDPDIGVVTPSFDVVIQRGVSFQNGSGDITDVAIVGHDKGVSIVDIFGRDNNAFEASGLLGGAIPLGVVDPAAKQFIGLPPTELVRIDDVGAIRSVDIVDTTASQSTTFIAVSDEELLVFDYRVALSIEALEGKENFRALLDPDAGTGQNNDDAFEFVDAGPGKTKQGSILVGSLPHGLNAPTRVELYGRFALVTHAGGLAVFELDEAGSTRASDVDLGAPLALLANFETSRPALDVVAHGRFAYVATGEGGVVVFDIGPVVYPLFEIGDNGQQPQPVNLAPIGTALTNLQQPADTRGLAMWGSRLVVADGRNGLRILDCSTPADCRLEETISNIPGGGSINNASQVVMASVPTRTFAIVANDNAVLAVNVTATTDFRLGLKAAFDDPDAFRGLRLSHERNDPLTPFDPKNVTRQVLTFPTSGTVTGISRGSPLDNLADKSARRLRDAWTLGARPLSERTLARMRSVVVKEVPNTKDSRGDGLGCVVRAGDEGAVQVDAATQRCIPNAVP